MLQPYINLKFLDYLSKYDLSQKFMYKTYFLIPKYAKINLKIYLKGFLNENFLNTYLKNFLLLYFFCFNLLSTKLKFKRIRRRKLKSYKVKLLINYFIMKKKILFFVHNLFFYLKKFLRPFYFSNKSMTHCYKTGKLKALNSKIITLLPGLILLDHKERRFFPHLKKSKVFLTFTLYKPLFSELYNFFIPLTTITKNFLKNFLLVWHLL